MNFSLARVSGELGNNLPECFPFPSSLGLRADDATLQGHIIGSERLQPGFSEQNPISSACVMGLQVVMWFLLGMASQDY